MTRPVSILLCEDDELALEYLRETLSMIYPACNFLSATDGEMALRHLEAPLDILVTDLNMPHMDGYELLKEAQSLAPSLKTIVVTAYGEKTVQAGSEETGIRIDHYVCKPIDLGRLSAVLDQCMAEIRR